MSQAALEERRHNTLHSKTAESNPRRAAWWPLPVQIRRQTHYLSLFVELFRYRRLHLFSNKHIQLNSNTRLLALNDIKWLRHSSSKTESEGANRSPYVFCLGQEINVASTGLCRAGHSWKQVLKQHTSLRFRGTAVSTCTHAHAQSPTKFVKEFPGNFMFTI